MDLTYLANVRPSHRQYAWQKLEFYGFLHFGMDTMTGREWGTGHEDLALFNPQHVDADQWVRALKDAGMAGAILTCKHHDGFCLWPSRYTDHTVAATPWRDGQGDLVREVSEACARHGLKFGVYLSPWDMTEPSYGSGRAYDDFYVAQLVELLTGYGEIFTVWLDGANGEGPDGRRQVYDWARYYRTVRALQPDAVINVCGPDVRWCGNEAGHTRPDEWSVVPRALQDAERTAGKSQKVDEGTFSRAVRSDEDDLGSRAMLDGPTGDLVWYPAEVNTSIRPGWFHHPQEDAAVRGPAELLDIYERSVGGNSTFLLNVPPTRDGLVAEADVAALAGLGRLLDDQRRRLVGPGADVTFSSNPTATTGEMVTDLGNDTGFWRPDAGDPTPTITLRLPAPATVEGVVLKEQITVGQRIEHVEVHSRDASGWRLLTQADSVGYQRTCRFPPTAVTEIQVRVTRSRLWPTLAGVALLSAAPAPHDGAGQ